MLRLPSQGHRGFLFFLSRPAHILSSWILRSESFLSARSTASNSLNRKLAKTSYRAQLGAVQPTYLTQLLAGSHRKRLARSSHFTAHQHSGKAHIRTTDSRRTIPHQRPLQHRISILRRSNDHPIPISSALCDGLRTIDFPSPHTLASSARLVFDPTSNPTKY